MKAIEKKCNCELGLDKCKSPLYIGSNSISRKPSELLKCGKVIKLIEKLSKIK